jgi:hypothetical protein
MNLQKKIEPDQIYFSQLAILQNFLSSSIQTSGGKVNEKNGAIGRKREREREAERDQSEVLFIKIFDP